MNDQQALGLANDFLRAFVENQDIPPGSTTGTAASHGEKTAQFLTAMHRTMYDYFRGLEDAK
jgi:hypothetical protein